jgi:hypothetical protein
MYHEKAMKGPVALHNKINIPDIQYYSNSLPVGKGLEGKVRIRSAY